MYKKCKLTKIRQNKLFKYIYIFILKEKEVNNEGHDKNMVVVIIELDICFINHAEDIADIVKENHENIENII